MFVVHSFLGNICSFFLFAYVLWVITILSFQTYFLSNSFPSDKIDIIVCHSDTDHNILNLWYNLDWVESSTSQNSFVN